MQNIYCLKLNKVWCLLVIQLKYLNKYMTDRVTQCEKAQKFNDKLNLFNVFFHLACGHISIPTNHWK